MRIILLLLIAAFVVMLLSPMLRHKRQRPSMSLPNSLIQASVNPVMLKSMRSGKVAPCEASYGSKRRPDADPIGTEEG